MITESRYRVSASKGTYFDSQVDRLAALEALQRTWATSPILERETDYVRRLGLRISALKRRVKLLS